MDSGNFQINDIVLDIPPESISVRRNTVNNFWKTLRTKSSMKTRSGYSTIDIEVSAKFEDKDLYKLQRLIAGLRVTPFCWVENAYIRSVVLGGQEGQDIALAVRQIQIVKADAARQGINIVDVYISFVWFNYFPFLKEFKYRTDIFLPQRASSPIESKAWNLLIQAEMDRVNYQSVGSLSTAGVKFSTYQFAIIPKADYLAIRSELTVLKQLYSQIDTYIQENPEANKSEFSGVPPKIYDNLTRQLGGDSKTTDEFLRDIFGNTTSMIMTQEGLNDLKNLIVDKEEQLAGSFGLVTDDDSWLPQMVSSNDGQLPLEFAETPDLTLDTVVEQRKKKTSISKILMRKNQTLDFDQLGLITTSISISFENQLVTIPLIGHPFPTYQYLGSNDGVVTLSIIASSEEAIEALSSFYSMAEAQAMNFRLVPMGMKNINVSCDVVNLCGLHEFIFEDLVVETVPGSPGTYSASLTLVDNPISATTYEQLVPTGKFITTNEKRNAIFNIFDGLLKLDQDKFKLNYYTGQRFAELETSSTLSNNSNSLKTNLLTGAINTATSIIKGVAPVASVIGAAVNIVTISADFENTSAYSYIGKAGDKYALLQTKSDEVGRKLTSAVVDVSKAVQENQTLLPALFMLSDNDVIGVSVIQRDVLNLLQYKNKFLGDNFHGQGFYSNRSVIQQSSSLDVYTSLQSSGLTINDKIQIIDSAIQARQEQLRLDNEIQDTYKSQAPNRKMQSFNSAEIDQLEQMKTELLTSGTLANISDIRSQLSDWINFITKFCDEVLMSDLIFLDEFKSIKDLILSNSLQGAQDVYPDFPLQDLVRLISKDADYASIIGMLKATSLEKGLDFQDLGLSSLINPDFYMCNHQTDTTNTLLSPDIKEKIRNSILISQGESRLNAEKNWLQQTYEKTIIGPKKADLVRQSLLAKKLEDDQQPTTSEQVANKILEKSVQEGGLFLATDYPEYLYPSLSVSSSNIILEPIDSSKFIDGVAQSVTNMLRVGNLCTLQPAAWANQIVQTTTAYGSLFGPSPSAIASNQYKKSLEDPVFSWPTSDEGMTRITSPFGQRRDNINGKIHIGIDIAHKDPSMTTSLEVRAAADGWITNITKDFIQGTRTYGETGKTTNPIIAKKPEETTCEITISHKNGWKTIYKHMTWESIKELSDLFHRDENTVFFKDYYKDNEGLLWVKAEQQIGMVGSTGYSSGPHLHFAMKKDEASVNPYFLLKGVYSGSWTPPQTFNPDTQSLFDRSIEQFQKEISNGQGGSLMRAYPGFKLFFIESDLGERRVYGFDDFFSYSAIKEIMFISSRKIAADLLIIQLTNISGVLSNRRFMSNKEKHRRADSGFVTEEPDAMIRNTIEENPIASLMLQPGTQVQLKLGNSNNHNDLETVFNGQIADVKFSGTDDIVEIICQTFTTQLVQNIHGDAKSFGGFFSKTGRTSSILQEVLAMPEVTHFGRWEGGSPNLPDEQRSLLTTRWSWNPKPADDNIFAPAQDEGFWGYFAKNTQYTIYNTTLWDVIQEMTLRHPGYIASAVPYDGFYGPRMTLYFGLPDQLYFARDPTILEQQEQFSVKNFVKEEINTLGKLLDASISDTKANEDLLASYGSILTSKQDDLREYWIHNRLLNLALNQGFIRPFRSYHLLTSDMHIIDNKIENCSWNTFNTVTLEYTSKQAVVNETIEKLLVDDSLTLTTSVDAGLPDEDVKEYFVSYPNCVGLEAAKRYSVAILKETMKNGYRGHITIIGNPKIKPYDICFIADQYSDMYGPIEVEQVIHKFSPNNGFITEIIPDMCIHVNESSTMATQDAMGLVAEHMWRKIGNPLGIDSVAPVVSGASKVGSFLSSSIQAATMGIGILSSINSTAGHLLGGDASLGISGGSLSGIIGAFITKKLLTRTQLAQPLRASPLTISGKPMFGGFPVRTTGSVFTQGVAKYVSDKVEKWVKDVRKSAPLYVDHITDRMAPNNWIRPQGQFFGWNGSGK